MARKFMNVKDLKTLKQSRAEYFKNLSLKDFYDSEGYIGNKFGTEIDCGDSLQRAAMLAVGSCVVAGCPVIDASQSLILKKYKIGTGLYVRRPGPTWMGNLNTTTGDQIRPLVVALGLLEEKQEVRDIFWQLFKRAGFYWNTRDTGESRANTPKNPGWSGPEHLAIFLRALYPKSKLINILLYPLDLVGLASTAYSIFKTSKEAKFSDQLNRMIVLLQGILVNPTLISKLSMYIFRKYRPTWDIYVDGNNLRFWRENNSLNPGQYVLDNYFWNKDIDPPIEQDYNWIHICQKYFSRIK